MPVELKLVGSGSWLDAQCAKRMSARLGHRLWERCKGHQGLFVTLTYNRAPYRDGQDLYRKQSEQQHVPLFLRKVAKYLGRSLKGKWFCKLEFQQGGWVHWHIIILDVARIPSDELARMWGHGFVKIRRLSPKNAKYCTKYTVKADDVPAWLYFEPPRSLKIIRVSPGFWGEPVRPPKPSQQPDAYDEYGPGAPQRLDVYVPLGQRIEENKNRIVLRNSESKYAHVTVDLGAFLVALMERGVHLTVPRSSGWMCLDTDDLAVVEAAGEEAAAAPAAAVPPGLNLIRPRNPDYEDDELPWYIDEWYRQNATWGAVA